MYTNVFTVKTTLMGLSLTGSETYTAKINSPDSYENNTAAYQYFVENIMPEQLFVKESFQVKSYEAIVVEGEMIGIWMNTNSSTRIRIPMMIKSVDLMDNSFIVNTIPGYDYSYLRDDIINGSYSKNINAFSTTGIDYYFSKTKFDLYRMKAVNASKKMEMTAVRLNSKEISEINESIEYIKQYSAFTTSIERFQESLQNKFAIPTKRQMDRMTEIIDEIYNKDCLAK